MNKMVNLLLVGLVLFLAACGQTASNPEVVEVNEAPTQVSGMAVEPTTSLLEIGPFTVFAPAYKYEDIPQGTFATPKDFIDALRSHIVPGSYLQADLLSMDGQSIPTILEGKNINITVKDGTVYINDVAMLTQPDILAQNGVVHVIDQFLLPAGE